MNKVRLGDVAIERKETCPADELSHRSVGLEHLTPEEITLSNWDENADNTFTRVFHKGDVLFGRRRAYLKKAAVAPFDGVCSGDITVISAMPDKIEPRLLPFVIQNDQLFDYAVENSAGSLSPRVKWSHLKEYQFRLGSMAEQRKLADTLWSVNKTKEAYKRLMHYTDELVKSQFIEMFGDPIENDKHWDYELLPNITTFVLGSTPKSSEPSYWDGDQKWITPAELNDQTYIVNDSVRHITCEGVKAAGLTSFPKGTVIFSTRAPIGNTGIAGCEMYCNQGFKEVMGGAA